MKLMIKLEPKLKRSKKMDLIQQEFEILKHCGLLLQEFDYSKNSTLDTINFITEMETELWRCKIRIIRSNKQ